MKRFNNPLLCLLLALTGCAGSSKYAAKPLQLSQAKAKALAVRIMENTPEYVHFEPGAKFEWVLLDPSVKENPQVLQDEVLKLMKTKYTVYLRAADVPKDLKMFTDKGEVRAYKGGFCFSYKAKRAGWGKVEVQYGDYEASLAASGHSDRYRWVLGKWLELPRRGPMIVS